MDRRSWTMLVTVGAVWGGSFLLTAIAIRGLSVPVVSLLRTGVGALVLLPVALARGALRGVGRQFGPVVLLGVVQLALPFLLIGYGQRHVDSGLAGILVASTPLWTALLAVWIDQEERSYGWGLAGIAIGIAGVALLLGVELGGSPDALAGAVMLLLAGLGYALGGFLGKGRLRGLAPLGAVTAAMIAASAVLAPLALAALPREAPPVGSLAAAAALGAVSGGLGWFIYYTLLAAAGAARAAVAMYLVPGFAVVYGAVLHGEPLTVTAVLGLALVVSGSWLAATRRPPRSAAARSRPDRRSPLPASPPSSSSPPPRPRR